MSEIAEKLTAIVSEILELSPQEINLDQKLSGFMVEDSVVILEILVALERTFGIEIKEAEFKAVYKLRDLADLIAKKTQ